MLHKEILAQLLKLPEVAIWPDIATVFDGKEDNVRTDWEMPLLACQMMGEKRDKALPGSAAIACLQISIILVDDMLDDDVRGEYQTRGVGPTSNLALAFQAAAFRLIAQADVSDAQHHALADCLARAALETSVGQHLDVQNLTGEENYWRVIQAKSTPFYGAAYQLGAILGGATKEQAQGFYNLGLLIGKMVQIEDDLTDAFDKPANADWQQGRNNLLILYARTAEHPRRAYFESILSHIDNLKYLEEAQQLLIDSGAVSYAIFHLLKTYQETKNLFMGLDVPNPRPFQEKLDLYADNNLTNILQLGGLEIPQEMYTLPEAIFNLTSS